MANPTTIRSDLNLPYALVRGRASSLSVSLFQGGASLAVTSGTYLVRNSAGEQMASGAVTVSSGVASASYTAPSDSLLGAGWSVDWTLTTSEGVTSLQHPADVVRTNLACPVAEADLYRVYPSIDPSGARSLVPSTADHDPLIQEAWIETVQRLRAQGVRYGMATDAGVLRGFVLNYAISLVLESLTANPGSNETYAEAADRYMVKAEAAWSRVRITEDTTGDGVPDEVRQTRPALMWL